MPFKYSPTHEQTAGRSQPLRIGFKPLLLFAFAGPILVALSGAFLLGLVVVGLFATAIGAVELIRRHIVRPARPALAAFARRPIGY